MEFKLFDENNKKIFKDKLVLIHNWIPNAELILHRNDEMKKIASCFNSLFHKKITVPSNLMIYGSPGCGKTLMINIVKSELNLSNIDDFNIVYVKCSTANSELYVLQSITHDLGMTTYKGKFIYQYYKLIEEFTKKRMVTVILDELDKIEKSNSIIFSLSRIPNVSIVGIANNQSVTDNYEPSTKSSFSPSNIIIPPYNAKQLVDILKKRAEIAFKKNAICNGVVEKCAALAAQEHGDARRALDLLRTSGEIAEEKGTDMVLIENVDDAESRIDFNSYINAVKVLTKQSKIILKSIIQLHEEEYEVIETGDVYNLYESLCKANGLRVLTQKRVSTLISELDIEGIINAKVISKGRYGTAKEIRIVVASKILEEIKKIVDEVCYDK